MGIQDIPTMPFDRFGCGYHAGDEFIDSPIHLYFNAEGYNDNPKFFNSEDDALLLIQILRTAIKVAYEVDPFDPVGALELMRSAVVPAREVPAVEGFLHGVRPPSPLPMITADEITSGSLSGPDEFKAQCDVYPFWLREILECPRIHVGRKQGCIEAWKDLEAGKYPSACYVSSCPVRLSLAFLWDEVLPSFDFWSRIDDELVAYRTSNADLPHLER